MYNSYLPASVPLTRDKNKEEKMLEEMKGLDGVLSQQTLAFGSFLDGKEQSGSALKEKNDHQNQ